MYYSKKKKLTCLDPIFIIERTKTDALLLDFSLLLLFPNFLSFDDVMTTVACFGEKIESGKNNIANPRVVSLDFELQ